MKYFITFIFTFIIGIISMSISADAFSFQQVDIEDVPYMQTQVNQAFTTLQNQNGFTDNYYIIVSYYSNSLFVMTKCSFTTSDTVSINNDYWGTPNRNYNYMCRIESNRPTFIQSYGSNNNQVVSNFNANNNYLIANTIPIVFNGNTYEVPEELQGDTFFVTKEGFTNNFGVFCGPGSELVEGTETDLASNYYRTKQYTVHIKFSYQGSTIDYTIPNYLNWLYKYNVYVRDEESVSNVLEYLNLYTWYAEPVYNTSMQAIRCPIIKTPSLLNYMVFEEMTDYRSFNQITLSQLLNALTSTYPNLTINDLYTALTFEFYDTSNHKVYSAINDYSSLHNSGIEPTPDPYITNLTDSTETLNQNITSNNQYLKDIIYGDVYTPAPYEHSIKDAGSINLDLISVPDYTYTEHTLNTDATSFFGRMVEWWYLDTPFGIIATVALTLLVIKVIIW